VPAEALLDASDPALETVPDPPGLPPVESYEFDGTDVVRRVRRRDGSVVESRVAARENTGDAAADFDLAWLRSTERAAPVETSDVVTVVDLFCGCGGATLGLEEAARALGLDFRVRLAVDFNQRAADAYAANFPDADVRVDSVEALFPGKIGSPLTAEEAALRDELGPISVLIGGPPCQGHSDLNNHTRRDDPKNALYLRMARAAEVLRPDHVLIENVPGVVHSKDSVVARTQTELVGLDYAVDGAVVHAARLGVAQRRRRYFMAASRTIEPSLEAVTEDMAVPERPLDWAITDLRSCAGETVVDTSAVHSDTNRSRIDYLFDHDLHDLPDTERPDCHRLKPHSYRAVYGRLWGDRAAPTITSGFGSTGQGRFVHPHERRTMTPHEAARVQFFPDFFSFDGFGRAALQEMIGNAVPPKLGYVIGLELLR